MTTPFDATAAAPGPPARPVTGIVLRYALVVALHDHGRPLTVRQLCAILDRQRLAPSGRAGKAVSDALRWEVDRGRVRRTARATYAIGQVARQTIWRMRRRVARHGDAPRTGDCR